MRVSLHSPDDYRTRRRRVRERLGDAALVVTAGKTATRNGPTEYPFRPEADFFYLTGLSEPGAVLIMRPGHSPDEVVFVRPRDAAEEVWSGRRPGPEGAVERYGLAAAEPIANLESSLPRWLDGASVVWAPLGRAPRLERLILAAIAALARRNRWGDTPPRGILDVRELLGEERIVKDAPGLAALRRAVDISVQAHLAAMAMTAPGVHEYALEARIAWEMARRGSGPGYGTIVGGGDNATILHYIDNRDALAADALVLVDAGAEVDLFTGDLTRTWPVCGRFGAAERAVYEIVLAANEQAIEQAVVGSDIERIHATALSVLCEGLCSLALFPGRSPQDILADRSYEAFYMHRTSHWLGMDVHDTGRYTLERKPRPLQPGFVLTVEPGLYFSAADERVPPALRGIGVRIEDDILVTAEGPEVLTHRAPKRIADVEARVGLAPEPPSSPREAGQGF